MIGATVRGHLLLQLLHRAHDERLEGDSPRLQALVRPLQAALGDPRAGASDWGKLAAVQVGSGCGTAVPPVHPALCSTRPGSLLNRP